MARCEQLHIFNLVPLAVLNLYPTRIYRTSLVSKFTVSQTIGPAIDTIHISWPAIGLPSVSVLLRVLELISCLLIRMSKFVAYLPITSA